MKGMVRIFIRDAKGTLFESGDISRIPLFVADKSNTVWVDLYDPGDSVLPEVEQVLREVMQFHPLAVDDALVESHVPKVDDWGDYLYIVLHAVNYQAGMDHIETQEVDAFVGANYLVTHHTNEVPALSRLWQTILRDERLSRRGVDYLLYELCDFVATDYMPVMDRIDEAIDTIQDTVFDSRDPRAVQIIFKLKSTVLELRRVLSPQREVLNKLARGDFPMIDPRDRVYFRDVYDHFVRLTDLNESLRDLVAGSLDTYLSVTANRTNEVMKVLTIITVLFMPLTFITGFFGMNFFGGNMEVFVNVPPWLMFAAAMFIMIGVPAAMLMYIRRRGWW
jgi:magnesium transporter